ncbi:MAG TPA: MarR family transcriptional regulator [Jatrophihabitantaceae bacterium]
MAQLPDLPDDRALLWFMIRRVAGAFDRTGERLFQRELNLSLAQFLVLSVVDAYPGDLSQQVIADRLGLTKGTVSRQIDKAVADGLMTVAVSERTRRENKVSLTAAGTDLVRRGDALFSTARQAGFPDISDKDMAATLRTLSKLDDWLGESR